MDTHRNGNADVNDHKLPGQGRSREKDDSLDDTPGGTLGSMSTTHVAIPADRRVVDGILARLHRPGGVEEFTTQVRSARGCRRPVRLAG